eukprot:286110-Lingulodinium_polyedra.AAC.1
MSASMMPRPGASEAVVSAASRSIACSSRSLFPEIVLRERYWLGLMGQGPTPPRVHEVPGVLPNVAVVG